jgi:hypothetical protein
MKNDIFIQDSVVNTPFLNITYYNNCTENYYFFKVSSKDAEKNATAGWFSPYYNDMNFKKRAKENLNYYTNYNFNVTIDNNSKFNIGWWIDCTKEDYNKEWAGLGVGNSIDEIYSYLRNETHSVYDTIKSSAKFLPSDITPENILNSIMKEHFVFLQPRGVHTDSYNLIAYKIVGGCFTFIIEHNTIENYVLFGMGLKEEEIELPAVVGEYHRYSGAFNTNKVTVCFGGE